jgi:hypothetical protein
MGEKSEGKRQSTKQRSTDRRMEERPIFSGRERAAALPAVAAKPRRWEGDGEEAGSMGAWSVYPIFIVAVEIYKCQLRFTWGWGSWDL